MKSMIACGCLTVVITTMSACNRHHESPMSVSDLMDDRVSLDGVLMKCNRNPAKAHTDSDCVNARIAIERLESQNEPAHTAKAQEDFERSREQLRSQQDKQRQEQEAKTKVDVYHLPLVPVDPTPAPKDPQSPIVGQTKP
jgi:hypothetical protein